MEKCYLNGKVDIGKQLQVFYSFYFIPVKNNRKLIKYSQNLISKTITSHRKNNRKLLVVPIDWNK